MIERYPGRPAQEHFKEHSFEDRVLFDIDFEVFIERSLDIRELVVSLMLIGGYTVVEIAKHQNVSRRYITRVVMRLRNKFRRFLDSWKE